MISQPFLFYINTRNKYFLFLALTFVDKKDRIILSDKRRVELTKPKIGRPTDDPNLSK